MTKIIFLLLLAGCAVGPNYQPPENAVTNAWASGDPSDESPVVIDWWNVFEDALLSKYVEMAEKCNFDVLTAESHILQARALRQVAASSFFPHIGVDVNATKTYFSKNGPVFESRLGAGALPGAVSPGTGLTFQPQVPQMQSLYNALFDASWEIDLFGKTRRMVEAADAIIGRTIEERNDTLISVMAEVARNYIEVRSFQKKEELIQENIRLLEQRRAVVEKQFAAGYVSRLDDKQAEAQLSDEKALLPDIKAQIHRCIYALSVLVGSTPETLLDELLIHKALPQIPDQIAVGLRSDLLRRRPDIRRAERDLAAATAHEGVAVAAFFPTITLIGDGGLQSLALKNLFSLGSRTWGIGGDILMPIFEGGKLRGNLKAKRAETAATFQTYQQTVLSALEETESNLMLYTQDLETVSNRKTAADHYQEISVLSQKRYDKGLTSVLEFIAAERELNSAQQAVLESETASLLDLVSLYKSLGGGWEIRSF